MEVSKLRDITTIRHGPDNDNMFVTGVHCVLSVRGPPRLWLSLLPMAIPKLRGIAARR